MRLAAKKALLILAMMLLPVACGDKSGQHSQSRETEKIGNNAYYNSHFGVSVTKPEDWYALNDSENATNREVGAALLFDEDNEIERVRKIVEKRTTTLFSFYQYAPGSPVEFNPAVTGLAEDISHAPGVKSGQDYFFHMKKLLNNSGLHYEFAEGYGQRQIGGVNFDRLDLKVFIAGNSVAQSYYAARRDNTMFVFIESYGNEDGKAETSAVLDAIKLDWAS